MSYAQKYQAKTGVEMFKLSIVESVGVSVEGQFVRGNAYLGGVMVGGRMVGPDTAEAIGNALIRAAAEARKNITGAA